MINGGVEICKSEEDFKAISVSIDDSVNNAAIDDSRRSELDDVAITMGVNETNLVLGFGDAEVLLSLGRIVLLGCNDIELLSLLLGRSNTELRS